MMKIAVATITLYAPWINSLKEKRSVVKSLCAKIRQKFNVSASETFEQDKHQLVVISFAAIAANSAQADSIIDNVYEFIENNTEAEVMSFERLLI